MKVIAESIIEPENTYTIKLKSVKYCCPKMKEAWGEQWPNPKFIGFGEYDPTFGRNKNINVNIFHCTPYYSDEAEWIEMAIKYCPFCKEEIEIIIEDNRQQK